VGGDKPQSTEKLAESMKKAAAALRAAEIPYAVGGGIAIWARGGPETGHDVDILIRPQDAERGLEALERAGLRPEDPPEDWLVKAYDGDVLVDLIFNPSGGPVTDELLARSQEVEVIAMRVPLVALEDILTQKLHALTEQEPDFTDELEIARSLREQIDWAEVRRRTADSPFAQAFFTLIEELGIVPGAASGSGP
jgi:predicted nucleotidyltransferase